MRGRWHGSQPAPSSRGPTARPRTSRSLGRRTPIVIPTTWESAGRGSRPSTKVASSHPAGEGPSRRRVRTRVPSASRSAQRRRRRAAVRPPDARVASRLVEEPGPGQPDRFGRRGGSAVGDVSHPATNHPVAVCATPLLPPPWDSIGKARGRGSPEVGSRPSARGALLRASSGKTSAPPWVNYPPSALDTSPTPFLRSAWIPWVGPRDQFTATRAGAVLM